LLAVFATQRRMRWQRSGKNRRRPKTFCSTPAPVDRGAAQGQTRPIADHFRVGLDPSPTSSTSPRGRPGFPPAEVVGYLDRLFTHFDGLAEQYDWRRSRRSVIATWQRRASDATPGPCPRARTDGTRHGGDECVREPTSVSSAYELRIGINSGQSWPA